MGLFWRKNIAALTVSTATLFSGCSSIDVSHFHDPDVAFQSMSRWAWLASSAQMPGQVTEEQALLEGKLVRAAIRSELISKGYPQTRQEPDFHVTYHEGLDFDVEPTTFRERYGYGYRAWWSGFGRSGPMQEQTTFMTSKLKRLVTVDVITPGPDKALIWRGTARFDYKAEAESDTRAANIRSAVAKVLEGFPP